MIRNQKSRFETFLLAISIAASLVNSSCKSNDVAMVSIGDYRDLKTCWERKGYTYAFVVLHSDGSVYYPYLISPFCDLNANDTPKNAGFLKSLNAINLGFVSDKLKKLGNLDSDVVANAVDHTPVAKLEDPIYIFKGSLDQRRNGVYRYYGITDVFCMKKTNISLRRFVNMSYQDRRDLFVDSCSMN